MLMYEMFISAIPSFVLSLQPNTERVKGKFIPYVLSRAIPGALTMALGIFTLYVVHQTPLSEKFEFTQGGTVATEYEAMMMLALTFCGLVMLYRICQPFNIVRAVLFIMSACLCIGVVSVPLVGEFVFEGWSNIQLNLQQLVLLVIIIQASFPVSGFLIRFFDLINPAEEQ